MLDTLDILIGFTVVMLIVSMPVTMITQFITETLNLRGKALLQGVTTLLGLLDQQSLKRATAIPIAEQLLRDPLIAKRGLTGKARLAGTVLREELAKLIINYASKPEAALADAKTQADAALALEQAKKQPDPAQLAAAKVAAFDAASAVQASPKNIVGTVLEALGLEDPQAVLKAVRTAQLDLERSAPELANDVRVSMAMLTHASSDFLAKFNGWFDQTMDRVSETFTLYSRLVTALVAIGVALFLQLDSINLINRLSADKQVRDALVQSAIKDPERFDPQPSPAAALKRARADETTLTKDVAAAKQAAAAAKPDKKQELADRLQAAEDALSANALRVDIAEARDQAATAAKTVTAAKQVLDQTATPEAQAAYDKAVKEAVDLKATAATLANAPKTVVKLLSQEGVGDLVNLRLVEIPRTGDAWLKAWGQDWVTHLFGVLLTAALLSLGGPFWYALLQNLLKLRPLLARKDEEQRALRQTTQSDAAAAPAPAAAVARPLVPPGERGDLEAVG